ncbi:LysM peptidoglycan-binding domain-containing protein [Brevibacterium yomogidense]|uniref:LysM peptidoglycan-binding domain-containing protein n=1 Tax=Brevibacterium yomogidense TaxID=946573 RepID=UPI0018DFC0E8|nr:LysM peptidoglycan-binding domain-containing protein [Brevibacterium yomogidense]
MSASMLTRTAGPAAAVETGGARRAHDVEPTRRPGMTRRGRLARTVLLGVVVVAVLIGVVAAVWSPTAAADEDTSATGIVTVIVDEGDSLWSVVSDHSYDRDPRVVLDEVRTLNGMTTNVVHPGQRLDLPAR